MKYLILTKKEYIKLRKQNNYNGDSIEEIIKSNGITNCAGCENTLKKVYSKIAVFDPRFLDWSSGHKMGFSHTSIFACSEKCFNLGILKKL